MKRLNILFIEPFYGGSHKDFADGLIKHSRHGFTLHSLPARYWKWRMRGAALHFSEVIKNPEDFDLLFTSDMMSLSDLKMLWGRNCPPAVVYFHENQLSYPLPEGEKMDYQFGFTDITTGLAADRLIFNSNFHMNTFLYNMPGFIKKMPEFKPLWVVDKIKEKSSVIYPGCNFEPETEAPAAGYESADKNSPLILWSHRWEFDKCPEVFFRVLEKADRKFKSEGVDNPFNLAILGENFQAMPQAFIDAKDYYKGRILQYGFCESRNDYHSWLKKSDIIISTAIQENFGIAVAEAIQAGCTPLLPDRLSYPELIPEKYHRDVIYKSETDLYEKLICHLENFHSNQNINRINALSEYFDRFSWSAIAPQFDEYFANIY